MEEISNIITFHDSSAIQNDINKLKEEIIEQVNSKQPPNHKPSQKAHPKTIHQNQNPSLKQPKLSQKDHKGPKTSEITLADQILKEYTTLFKNAQTQNSKINHLNKSLSNLTPSITQNFNSIITAYSDTFKNLNLQVSAHKQNFLGKFSIILDLRHSTLSTLNTLISEFTPVHEQIQKFPSQITKISDSWLGKFKNLWKQGKILNGKISQVNQEIQGKFLEKVKKGLGKIEILKGKLAVLRVEQMKSDKGKD